MRGLKVTYLSPKLLASNPSFVHASCSTSLRALLGVTFMTARRALESITTSCEDIGKVS